METLALKQIGKLIFNNQEILLTSTFTILGRTPDITFSKDVKGNVKPTYLEYISKLGINEEEIKKIQLNFSSTLSKNALLLKFNDASRYIL